MLEALLQALLNFADLGLWASMMAGVIAGIVTGVIPGIGPLIAMAIFLPFCFYLTPEQAFPFFISASAVGFMGGSISAILVGVPGTGPNIPATLDGYPMTQRGEGGRALGASITSSTVGSILSMFLALAVIPLVMFIVMALRSADMVFIIILGLALIATLSRGSMIKGLISGGLGILLSLVGMGSKTAIARFTFGSVYLYDGLPTVPTLLGLIAVPLLINLAVKGGMVTEIKVAAKGMQDVWRGVKDVLGPYRWLCIRSSIIGYVIGLIPGLGAEVACWVCYGQAKQTSKNSEKFGKGCIEGVIAPESGCDAKEAGALLTTLALGIPGSMGMALLLAAFLMVGLVPGPGILTDNLSLSLTLLYIISVATVIGAIICLFAAPHLAKTANIPVTVMVPMLFIIIFAGTFVYREEVLDVLVLAIFSGIGLAVVKFGYNAPAMILGLILGKLFEYYLFIALGTSGPLFFLRPISLGLIVITIALLFSDSIKNLFKRYIRTGRSR